MNLVNTALAGVGRCLMYAATLGMLLTTPAPVASLELGATVVAPLPAQADGQSPDAVAELSPESRAVADRAEGRIRSPFCPGLMLEVCPTPQASALRDTIRAWAGTGVTADSIVALVVAQYGEEYRGYPEPEGRGWLAWLVPPAVMLLGVLAIAAALKHLRRSGEARAHPVTEADADEVKRALRELEEAEGSVF